MSYVEWGALGLLLCLLELFVPGVYLIWFGFAGLIVSYGIYLDWVPADAVTWQLLVFSVASCVTTALGVIIYKKAEKHFKSALDYKNLNDLAGQYVGTTVTLIQDVIDGKSKVKVGDSVWLAVTDENLKAGDTVLITGVEKGLIFIVTKK